MVLTLEVNSAWGIFSEVVPFGDYKMEVQSVILSEVQGAD